MNNKSNYHEAEKLKEIPKWTRKYAQNRTLTKLVNLIIFLLTTMGIGFSSLFVEIAFKAGNMVFLSISVVALLAISICLCYFSIPKLGGIKLWRWIDNRIYGKEGAVSIPESELMKKKKWVGYVVVLIFAGCIQGSLYLGFKGYITIEYMQPVSALYIVPFLIFLYFWQKPRMSPLMLLWPILYSIHATLIVAGVPILFPKNYSGLNMSLPTFGYGFLTFTICHLYSRYALRKLKGITGLEGGAGNGA